MPSVLSIQVQYVSIPVSIKYLFFVSSGVDLQAVADQDQEAADQNRRVL